MEHILAPPCPDVEDDDLKAWARSFAASPAADERGRRHRRIVGDLLSEWEAAS